MSDVGSQYSADLALQSDPAEAQRFQEDIERRLKAHRYSEHDIFSIKLALEEALVNAIKHGNQFDRTKKVHVTYTVLPERFEIVISDEGCGFDPADVPDPTSEENLERPCGRGLMLMRYYMHEVTFRGRGNCVAMTRLRNGTQ